VILHPRFTTLVSYVHRELSPKRRARVSAHILGCRSCKATVDSLATIRDRAPSAYSGTPDPDTMSTVRRRWDAGERVILPSAEVTAAKRRYGGVLAAAAGIALLVATGLIIGDNEARANRSLLQFDPVDPRPGDTVQVEYQATGWLGGEERLYLRARYRTALDMPRARGAHAVDVTQLMRSGRGRYSGILVLPDSAVYAVFAVEDSAARRVDSNSRRLWEWLEQGDGKPTRDALLQKHYDLIGENWELAYETARVATDLYPEDPFLWYYRQSLETALLGSLPGDSLGKVHRARIDALHSKFASAVDLTAEQLSGMYWLAYGSGVADTAVVQYWRHRLLVEAPNHPSSVQERALDIVRQSEEVTDALQELESLWRDVGPTHTRLARLGLDWAFRARDKTRILTWLHRRETIEPWSTLSKTMRLLEIPATRDTALIRLRAELDKLKEQGSSERDLDETMSEWRRESAARRRTILTAIGRGQVVSGRLSQGLDTLRLAAEDGWDSAVFRTIADVRIELGDTLGALNMLSRVVVDPGTSPTVSDSLDLVGSRIMGADMWLRAVRDSRLMMYERTLRMAADAKVSLDLPLQRSDGSRTTLLEETRNRVAVVAFWSRYCAPALSQLRQLQAIAERLEARNVSLLAITGEQPSQDLSEFLAAGLTQLPVYSDSRGEAGEAFNVWGTPRYFVMDADGRLRFERVELGDVERYATALASVR
jgi:peroxiredoxin